MNFLNNSHILNIFFFNKKKIKLNRKLKENKENSIKVNFNNINLCLNSELKMNKTKKK